MSTSLPAYEWSSDFDAVRQSLENVDDNSSTSPTPPSSSIQLEHCDVTCDGCETEPIRGARYRCSVCQDRDLCSACYRALIAARVKRSNEPDRYASLLDAVPCLDATHTYSKVKDGPERQVVLTRTTLESIPRFAATFPPARCASRDVAFLVAWRPRVDKTKFKPSEARVDAAIDAFEQAVATWRQAALDKAHGRHQPSTPTRSTKIDAALVRNIAQSSSITTGKWMIFPRTSEVNAVWRKALELLSTNQLGDTAWIKVSSFAPTSKSHVLMCYTHDFTNQPEVDRTAEAISRHLLPLMQQDHRLLYKADIYSILNLYAGNEWGIKPTVYSSPNHHPSGEEM